jgi:Fibronectin type III domain
VTATFGNGSAAVTWQQPATDGGSPMTSYTVTSQVISPGGGTTPQVTVPASTTTTIVNGLTNGTTYIFTVVATNAIGTGPASAPSNPVTPVGAITGLSVRRTTRWRPRRQSQISSAICDRP